ncbi:asparagine synthase [Nonomuraea sp. MG754425]|uniref:asparagine synthase-related protein n=1 Tax=Nonomuraea sp. MG754425 TaxID=2570319 RepID=UPI001F0248FD|nr:asparagine synthase-related protein [Nonomuraea sp. MG754425]MCF6468135.1 asparagine synthase [Nonomuraea sp. MG754425]
MRRLSGAEFAVLPDGAAGQAVADALGGAAVLEYVSGRPCLVTTSPHEVTHAQAGRARLAVIGVCPVTAGRLAELAARLRCLEDADAVAAALPGSFHLVAVLDGRVRVQGTASGLRRVYYARVGGAVVASGRASLFGGPLDHQALAVRLLAKTPPVLAGPLWEGVTMVPPGDAAHLDRYGVRLRTWWRTPEPDLPLAEGAPALTAALEAAVDARVGQDAVVAGDLSGGLDSTPVSFLAASAAGRRSAKLVTFGLGVDDPAHDDERWAALAREHLPGEHLLIRHDELPGWFAGVARPVAGLDEPMRWLRVLDRELATSGRLAERGAAVRLTGHGGDEVALLPVCYLHDLARRRPSALWPHLRDRRSRARWPLASCARELADRRPYAAWLAGQSGLLGAPPPAASQPDFGWEPPLRLPSWTTPEVADAVRRRLATVRAVAGSPLRAQHQALSNTRAAAAVLDGMQTLTARAGAAVHAPFLDDHVIAACLAVRLDERAAPGVYKPLTRAAMRPVMPPECLLRTTKAAFPADFYQGLRRHRDQLLALLDGSLLVERGLADAGALHRACVGTPADAGPSMLALDVFVAAENWLRALPADGGSRATA